MVIETINIYRESLTANAKGSINYYLGKGKSKTKGLLFPPGLKVSLCLNDNTDLVYERVETDENQDIPPDDRIFVLSNEAEGHITGTVENLTSSTKQASVYLFFE